MAELPTPVDSGAGAVEWVARHLTGLFDGPPRASEVFRGTQYQADAALTGFDVSGYAAGRNGVLPGSGRSASMLSPYIRHGLLPLPEVWRAVSGGPTRDVTKFHDELMWQEYARHLYARLGARARQALRFTVAGSQSNPIPPAVEEGMACWGWLTERLHADGWLPNQARMWFASYWTFQSGRAWPDGEEQFFRYLLDGSRAANGVGWQWVSGALTGRPYLFSRYQVSRRAPQLCATCPLSRRCPIEAAPQVPTGEPTEPFGHHDLGDSAAGPRVVEQFTEPDAVWLTAESLGERDPALMAHPELPAVFIFDEPLLRRLQLAAPRLVFLVQRLAELAQSRQLHVYRGRPAEVLRDTTPAATYTPVPGWRRIRSEVILAQVHPWPWLLRPTSGAISSFSAWNRSLVRPPRR